jgi:hypothetical protein
LTRTGDYYHKYGITIQGFLLNGRGYDLPPAWVERFGQIAPDGIISPDFEIVMDWPTLIGETPYLGMAEATLGDSVELSAGKIHAAYREAMQAGRLPFLAFRSSFQTPHFLSLVYEQMQADDVADQIRADDGAILHPHYALVDPYTFFALLKIALAAK